MLVAQACGFSNAPFFPVYKVQVDIVDFEARTADNKLKASFEKGTIEAVTESGSCTVQLKLGQCSNGEEVWVNFRALQNDPTCTSRCTCLPTVWSRLKAATGTSLALAPHQELTRASDAVFVEVLVGSMQDTDGNGVVDKHTDENRLATRPMTVGRVDVHKATDYKGSSSWPPYGEFLADLEAAGPGIGYVRGRVDAAVDALDGTPVGPRCHWEIEALQEDN